MKKINLKGISEILSEKELKNVMGGCGLCNPCTINAPCTGSDGTTGVCRYVCGTGGCACATVSGG